MLPNHTSGTARKKILLILGALLAVNAAVAHIVIGQVTGSAGTLALVKDEQVSVPNAEEIADTPSAQEVSQDVTEQEDTDSSAITIYTVKSGDTISSIAKKFGISSNTVLWANEIPKNGAIKIGQNLVILPINGIQYKVQKGDTISGIAKKFKADADEILSFNDLEPDTAITPGMDLIIPDAEPAPKPLPKTTPKKSTPTSKSTVSSSSNTEDNDEETHETHSSSDTPVHGVLTQGRHAYNAVDIGAKTGTPVYAVKAGTVIVAKSGGAYNGGFGNMVVISHGDGKQTLYAHLSKVTVNVGDSVDAGDQIGNVGSTGKSTGPHLHIEYHGMTNPFVGDKKGTQY